MKNISMKWGKQLRFAVMFFSTIFMLAPSIIAPIIAMPMIAAAQTQPVDNVDLSSPGFKIISCDGPDLSQLKVPIQMTWQGKTVTVPPMSNAPGYIPCDFNGAMMQVQHLINIAIVVGVFAAIVLFCYAGYIYISAGMKGDANAHSTALDIFRKVGIGFIIMLSAWFIVYQILAWLTGTSGFGVLLGKPS